MKIRYDYVITGSFVVDYTDDNIKELLCLKNTDYTPSTLIAGELATIAKSE